MSTTDPNPPNDDPSSPLPDSLAGRYRKLLERVGLAAYYPAAQTR